jgi:tetratricopeptide (TPR) repeat protein
MTAAEKKAFQKQTEMLELILLKLIYVNLCLEDPVRAMTHVKRLLPIVKDPQHRYLALMYAAECASKLKKRQQETQYFAQLGSQLAASHDTQPLSLHESTLPSQVPDSGHMRLSTKFPQAAYFANLAAARCRAEQYDEALIAVKSALAIWPQYGKALKTRVFIHTKLGQQAEAIAVCQPT